MTTNSKVKESPAKRKSAKGGSVSRTEKKPMIISAPKFDMAIFEIKGKPGCPLVVNRFNQKLLEAAEVSNGKKAPKKRYSPEEQFDMARYKHEDGWDGFNATSIRKACITACKLCGYKMTMAQLSVFVVPNGWDSIEPQIPLIRIDKEPRMQRDVARVQSGVSKKPYLCHRPAYDDWSSKVQMRWDADQFNVTDIANLMTRVGDQIGIGEGRPDASSSGGAGMGWGLFDIISITELL